MGDEHPNNRAGNGGLEVLGELAAAAEPGEGAFDHPSTGQDAEDSGAISSHSATVRSLAQRKPSRP